MNIYVYEDQSALSLDPISTTRATFDIRIGAETFLDRIKILFPDASISLFVREELATVTSEKHSGLTVNPDSVEDGLWLLGNVIWNGIDFKTLPNSETNFYTKDVMVGAFLSKANGMNWLAKKGPLPATDSRTDINSIHCSYLWEILDQIPQTLLFESQQSSDHVNPSDFPSTVFMNPEQVFIGEDTVIQPTALINAEKGPVIIDSGVTIYGQTYFEGPLYIGKGSLVKPLTQIKNSVIGPMCKIGGELDTVIIQGYTNKVHDGHLGDAFLGAWINLGAGTQNSNLKNNYEPVKVQVNDKNVDTNSLHIGCFIGDHVKTAIGTLINTGTVIGAGAMIATNGFAPKTIRPFTWYVNGKHRKVMLDKFFETTYHVKKRRGKTQSEAENLLLEKLQNQR